MNNNTALLKRSRVLWRVVPLGRVTSTPAEWCECYCGAEPTVAIANGDEAWYVCDGCKPRFGWALRWPSRKTRRRLGHG